MAEAMATGITKHIFVTGGVASSLGKGLTASSLGSLLKARSADVFLFTRETFQDAPDYLVADASLGTTQWTLFALPAWILAIRPMELVGRAEGRDLVPVLVGTSLTQAVFGALLALGLLLGP